MKRLFVLGIVLLAALALAQVREDVVLSPQAIIVNPVPSFEVDVFLNREGQRGNYPVYTVGEDIRIGVRASEDAYIYLFSVHSNGEITQILPNRLDETGRNNYLRAGETRYFPPSDARYTFSIQGPAGLDKVMALASKEPLTSEQLRGFENEGDFSISRQGESEFAQTLAIVVEPLPQEAWVTDTALFHVTRLGDAPPQAAYGTLQLTSSPAGAAAYVDEQFVGYTPVVFGARAGDHSVTIRLPGQEPFQTNLRLASGETRDVSASFTSNDRRSMALMERLALNPYPESRIRRLDQSRDEVRFEFETRDSLQTTYEYFHNQLEQRGWQRTDLQFRHASGRVEAKYRQGGEELEFKLRRHGDSRRYRLDLELDD